jgi:hypothetical protein
VGKALTVSMLLIAFRFVNIPMTKANGSSTIVFHGDIQSKAGDFMITLYVYKYSSTVLGEDYYGFDILLHTDTIAYFRLIQKLVMYCPNATFDDWQPKAGSTGGDISLTPEGPSISVSVPGSDLRLSGAYSNTLDWYCNLIGANIQDLEFAARCWTNDTTEPLGWSIKVDAFSITSFLWAESIQWHDTAYYGNLAIPPDPPVLILWYDPYETICMTVQYWYSEDTDTLTMNVSCAGPEVVR